MEVLEARYMFTGDLVISEFLTDNDGLLLDNYGLESDWIEIHNTTAAAINLNGYFLTDDEEDLTKWQFPSVSISAGGYLLVYASNQDDRDPLQPLHTNFALATEGEYLGLIAPDGQTVVHEFAPEYPEQQENISYGVGQASSDVSLVAPGATAQSIVPTNSSHDAVWNQLGYTPDGNWTNGTTGVGYGQTFNGFLVRTYQANVSVGSPIGTGVDTVAEAETVIINPAARTSVTGGNFTRVDFVNTNSGNANDSGHYTGDVQFPGHASGTNYDNYVTETRARITIPSAGDWTFGVRSNEGFRLTIEEQEMGRDGVGGNSQLDVLETFTFPAAGEYELEIIHFERTGSSWLELFAAPGSHTSWNSADFDLVGDTAAGGLVVESDVVGSTGSSIGQLLGTNLESQMLGVNSSFYTRIPFNVTDAAAFDALKLRMKYDDAFVAYINGQEVARRNFVGSPVWSSVAGSARSGNEVLMYEDIDISQYLSALVSGPNVLAIHGLNFTASDPDTLIMPELIGTDMVSAEAAGYFATPTPGWANGGAYLGIVADTQFSLNRGFYDAPFQLEITTATPGAQIYYTTNGEAPTEGNGIHYTGPIDINQTTTLRAAAFLAGYLPTDSDTQTYLFLDDIVQQTYSTTLSQGFPTTWGTSVPNSNFPGGPDYGLDPDIVGNFDANGEPIGGDLFGGVYAAQLKDALLAIPTMSIVMDLDDLFSSSAGIYTNASQRGVAWERPTSVEWITPDDEPEFQVDAGIRIQGAFFRSNNNNLKKSFRLLFKDIYGPGKLNFPLFEGAVDSYNTLVLRGGGNDGYTWNSAKLTEQYTRDQFMRDLQLASGNASAHGNFAHLYINGVYWGLYNPVERPDNEFAASYFGGNPDNWDVVHRGGGTFEAQTGDFVAWDQMLTLAQQASTSQAAYMELQGKNLDGTPNAATPPLLDVVSYIDYIIVNAWGGNWDWPRNNFWAARDRDPLTTKGFYFFNWDGENTMGNNRSRSPVTADVFNPAGLPGSDFGQDGVHDNAGRPHILLRDNAEYRQLFADRVHRLFFNDGILTTENLIERYEALADSVELAMIGESARWGDMQAHRSPSPLSAITPADWLNERNWILGLPNTRGGDPYLPNRSTNVLHHLKNLYGLYPNTAAPTFNQHGGQVVPGFDLTMSAPAGTIWYTLDGSDPRQFGGAVSGTAVQYTGSPVNIPMGLTVKARVLDVGGWSALNEATFVTAVPADATNLRITEIHYNPAAHVGVGDAQDLEFIELMNVGPTTLTLNGVQISGFANTPYSFESGQTLAPGVRIVVTKNPAVFQTVYGTEVAVAPSGYGMDNLSNGGELVTLIGPLGNTLLSLTYDDVAPWPSSPDGGGPSLEIIDPMGDPNSGANWRASFYVGGSPGGSGIRGDYDGNGIVEQADYAMWRAHYGMAVASGLHGDGNGDGVVNTADYVVWRNNLGTGAASATSAAMMPASAIMPVVMADESIAQSVAEPRDQAFSTLMIAFDSPPATGEWKRQSPSYSRPYRGDASATRALQQFLVDAVVALRVVDGSDSVEMAPRDPGDTDERPAARDQVFDNEDNELTPALITLL